MDQPAITFEGVSFGYDGDPVLVDVSVSIAAGDFVSVIGPNGGGKTTLLKLALGLLRPGRGTVRVLGQAPRHAQRRIGYLPQHAGLDLQFPATVMDVALMGRLGSGPRFGPFRQADRNIALRALEDVGLIDLRHRSLAALSGGERQRSLIARALACEPEILLLDEPTANLDAHIQDELYQLLNRLNERLTVVIVSHDVGFVTKFVKSVVCVNRTVMVHHTHALTGEVIAEMYGHPMRIVHHTDSDCSVEDDAR